MPSHGQKVSFHKRQNLRAAAFPRKGAKNSKFRGGKQDKILLLLSRRKKGKTKCIRWLEKNRIRRIKVGEGRVIANRQRGQRRKGRDEKNNRI